MLARFLQGSRKVATQFLSSSYTRFPHGSCKGLIKVRIRFLEVFCKALIRCLRGAFTVSMYPQGVWVPKACCSGSAAGVTPQSELASVGVLADSSG